MTFAASGITVSPLVPVLVAYVVSLVTSCSGISGAFILLPFQFSVLGFTGPSVTATNHIFNIVAIPSGVYGYARERRMVWPLAAIIVLGTLPGVIVGSLGRIYLLSSPGLFKPFMGAVLLIIGVRLVRKVLGLGSAYSCPSTARAEHFQVKLLRFDWRRLEYEFRGSVHRISTPALSVLAAVVGVVGGAYGVGGGAIMAPLLLTWFALPVHTTSGATLLGTCLTSIVGVVFFALAEPLFGVSGVAPDWQLGLLFGVGGAFGMYTGARIQRYLPARLIEAVLGVLVTALALTYLSGLVL